MALLTEPLGTWSILSQTINVPIRKRLASSTNGVFFFYSEKGEDNILKKKTGVENLVAEYGLPNVIQYGQSYLNAYRFAQESSNTWCMRVLPNADDGVENPATFAHVILCVAKGYTDSGQEKYTLLPVYINEKGILAGANVIQGQTPTRFTYQKKIIPNTNEKTNTNLYDYIANKIVLTGEQITAILSDPELKGQFLDPKGITSLDNTLVPFIIFYGLGRGKYYNNIRISFKRLPNDEPTNPTPEYEFGIYEVTPDGVMTKEVFTAFFDNTVLDIDNKSMFVEHILKTESGLVRAYMNYTLINWLKQPTNSGRPIIDEIFAYTMYIESDYNQTANITYLDLKFGSDGDIIDEYGNVVANVLSNCVVKAAQGLYDDRVLNEKNIPFDIVFDANFNMGAKKALVNLAIIRSDCIAQIDMPPLPDIQHMLEIRDNDLTDAEGNVVSEGFHWLNTYVAALYSSWTTIKHPINGQVVHVAPSYHMSYIFPRFETLGIHRSVAGDDAVLTDVLGLDVDITNNPQVISNFAVNRINPFVAKLGKFIVATQKTTYRKDDPLAEINVVRTMFKLDRTINAIVDKYREQDLDTSKLLRLREEITNVLSDFQRQGSLTRYSVDIQATPIDLKHNRANIFVYVKIKEQFKTMTLNYDIN